ncbi:MAG: ATP-dependent helicase [Pseudomonadota bacterium]|jgi:superfamily I DNA/RNA helicase
MADLLTGLNDDQREAALYDGHCLTTACPGSGKTKTLAAKAAHILASTRSATVCAVTFTRESALEIRTRILQLAGPDAKPRLLAGTFHSLCFMQPAPGTAREGFGAAIIAKMAAGAKRARPDIATEGDRRGYLRRALDLAGLSDLEEEEAMRILEVVKSFVESPQADAGTPEAKLFHAYQDVLRRNGKIDFQDLVLAAVRGMRDGSVKPYPVDYLLVDEFQDTDELQYEWIIRHAEAGAKVTAVGDDDQSIYAWRCALGYKGMERFATDCRAHHVVLGMNYRCRSEILSAADQLVRNNVGRIAKQLEAAKGSGGETAFMQYADSEQEGAAAAEWCASWRTKGRPELAILARTNRRLDFAEAALVVRGIPYVRVGGGSIFDRPEVSVFADIMTLAAGAGLAGLDHALSWAGVPEQDLQVLHQQLGNRLIAAKKADLEQMPIERKSVEAWWEFGKRLTAWRDMVQRGKPSLVIAGIAGWMADQVEKDYQVKTINLAASVFAGIDAPLGKRAAELKNRRRSNREEQGDRVVLTTMHGAKGLEWERVWIVSAEEKVIPDEKAAVEEERRLMYVAMTRAKEQLIVSASAKAPVSRFVWEAGLERRNLMPEAEAA